MPCLTQREITGGRSELSPASRDHLLDCDTCASRLRDSEVGQLSSAASQASDATPFASPPRSNAGGLSRTTVTTGSSVGRFLILEKRGEGGMGVVFAAYDANLNRRVALKLLRVEHAADTEDAHMRLVREAQALAQLSHPNVVAVHEVGQHEGDVFIAMELVEGMTLQRWLEAKERSWRDVLGVCTAAGRGLAAAHVAGLVHRDFKPANVLVGNDGRVRVMDFGLARASSESMTGGPAKIGSPRTPHAPSTNDVVTPGLLHASVTQHGHVLGTPAYIAPELFKGEEADARSDQYSYCVSLFEALYAVKPPKENAATAPPPRGRKVPSWVHAVVVRGLSARPEQRFANLDALLDALGRDPSVRRRKLLMTAGAGALMAGAIAAVAGWQHQQRQLCSEGERQLVGIWDGDRRVAVQEALLGTGAPYAAGVWEYIENKLDGYTREWVAQYTDACLATSVRGEVSADVLDLRMACLHRARTRVAAVTDVLQSGDASAVQNAHGVVDGLDDLSRCADFAALRAQVQPATRHEAPAVERTRDHLAQAFALRKAGRFTEAKATLKKAEEALSSITYGPVRTEYALEQGALLRETGEYEASEAALRAALESGARWNQWTEVRKAATALLAVAGYELGQTQEGLRYVELARGLVEGQEDQEGEAMFHNNLGNISYSQGKYAEAEAEFRRALALRMKVLGPEHPNVADSLNNLGIALELQGKYADAEVEHRRALALYEKTLGPEHPDSATSHSNLGILLHAQGRYREAEAEHRHALAVRRKVLSPQHPDIATTRNNIGGVLHAQGRDLEAELELREALKLRRSALGPEHSDVAETLILLSSALLAQGRFGEAETTCREAVLLNEKVRDPSHPELAQSRHLLAEVFAAQRKSKDAETEYRRALAMKEKTLGPDHPSVAATRVGLASLLLSERRSAEALPLAESSWRVVDRDGMPSEDVGRAAFVLARALRDNGRDMNRARSLAERAAHAYEELAGKGRASARDEVHAWLKATSLQKTAAKSH